jgi:anti-sigma regulatory factor (Ser/Thr protein kinase)
MDAFPSVAAFAERVCAGVGGGRADALRLTLVLEELFTNTVAHGHGRDSEAPIHVTLEARAGGIAVTYEDTAPPFDPFAAAVEPPGEAVAVEDRPVGGLGLALVARLSRERGYAYAHGRNRISLVLPIARWPIDEPGGMGTP